MNLYPSSNIIQGVTRIRPVDGTDRQTDIKERASISNRSVHTCIHPHNLNAYCEKKLYRAAFQKGMAEYIVYLDYDHVHCSRPSKQDICFSLFLIVGLVKPRHVSFAVFRIVVCFHYYFRYWNVVLWSPNYWQSQRNSWKLIEEDQFISSYDIAIEISIEEKLNTWILHEWQTIGNEHDELHLAWHPSSLIAQ